MKSIHWLIGENTLSRDDLHASHMASVRMRVAIASNAITKKTGLTFDASKELNGSNPPNILVLGKIPPGEPHVHALWMSYVKSVKAAGGKVILDYTDNHLGFDTHFAELAAFYREALPFVDLAVCSSPLLQRALQVAFPGPIHVIVDPVEIDPVAPKAYANSPRTALWFGHSSNLAYLLELLTSSLKDVHMRLICLTDPHGQGVLCDAIPVIPITIDVAYYPWSIQSMLSAAAESDVCLIPSDPADPRKQGVSSNRLITAFNLGLPTAAEMLDSYREFSDYFLDIRSGELLDLFNDPLAYADKIEKAQRELSGQFSKAALASQWRDYFLSVTN